jgi:hypothetical protein
VFSGRGFCDELITRPEESYRLWCVVVCDLETSRIGAPYIYDISNLRVNKNDRCLYWESQIFLYLFIFAIRAWLKPDVYKASIRFPEWTKMSPFYRLQTDSRAFLASCPVGYRGNSSRVKR